MTVCNTENIKMMMRDAYNNLLDNDNSSVAGGYANGHYIMSNYNQWLNECVSLNEALKLHPDQGCGAELAVFYAYTAYTCATNGCLQNAYVIYMLGADVVQKYGSNKEKSALINVAGFCPEHFDATPASFDMYFFELMKTRAEHFAGYLKDMLSDSGAVKEEYAQGLKHILPELHRRAKIFEAYVTTKDMTKNWQSFAPYVADIYFNLARVGCAVLDYGKLCEDCLDKSMKYARVANDAERIKAIEAGRSAMQSKAKSSAEYGAASELNGPEAYAEYSSDKYEDCMAVMRERISKAAISRGLIEELQPVTELETYGKRLIEEMLFNDRFKEKYNIKAGQELASFVALAIDYGSACGAFAISNPEALKNGSAAKVLEKDGFKGYTENYYSIYEADAGNFKGFAFEIYIDHIQYAMEKLDKLPDKNFYLKGMLMECFKLGVNIAQEIYRRNRFRNA